MNPLFTTDGLDGANAAAQLVTGFVRVPNMRLHVLSIPSEDLTAPVLVTGSEQPRTVAGNGGIFVCRRG